MPRRRPRVLLILLSLGGLMSPRRVAAVLRGGAGAHLRHRARGPRRRRAGQGAGTHGKPAPDGPLYRFPADAGGALLAKVLPPADVKGPAE